MTDSFEEFTLFLIFVNCSIFSVATPVFSESSFAALLRASAAIEFNSAGIDFAMTALFVTVFVEQWLSTKNHLPALIGLAASVICLVIFGSDSFLIPSMIAITVFLALGRKKIEEAEGGAERE